MKRRLGFVILLYCIIFLGLTASQYWRSKLLSTDYMRQATAIQRSQIEAALDLYAKPMKQMADAYSTWSEAVAFVQSKNTQWATDYLDYPARNTYHVDAIWMFDDNYNQVYAQNYAAPNIGLPLEMSSKVEYAEQGEINYRYHFFTLIGSELYEIWGAPMIGEVTRWQTAPVKGHLMIGKHWNLEHLNRIHNLTQSQLEFILQRGRGMSDPVDPTNFPLPLLIKHFMDSQAKPLGSLFALPHANDASGLFEASWKGQLAFYFILFISGILVAFVSVQSLSEQLQIRKNQESALKTTKESLRKTLEEQEQLGRDMHDNVLQSVYALGLRVESVLTESGHLSAPLQIQLKEIKSQLNSIIEDLRLYLTRVEPGGDSQINLEKAFQNLVQSYRTTTECQIDLEMDHGIGSRLDPKQKNHLVLISKELLSNAIRHANPSKVVCRLKDWMDGILLEVINNGRSYESNTVDPLEGEGRGLKNIQSRAEEMGGTFRINAESSKLTTAALYVPTSFTHPDSIL